MVLFFSLHEEVCPIPRTRSCPRYNQHVLFVEGFHNDTLRTLLLTLTVYECYFDTTLDKLFYIL